MQDSFVQVELSRQKLEEQIAQLRKSLQYWQTWEAEYEGFKEELESLDRELTAEDTISLGSSFGGIVITEKEIRGLLSGGVSTTRSQLIDTVSKRVETGQKNVQSIQRQLNRAEAEVGRIEFSQSVATSDRDDEPVLEIYEELDDSGNVISSRLVNANETTNALEAALREEAKIDKEAEGSTQAAKSDTGTKENHATAQTSPKSTLPAAESASSARVGDVSGAKKPGLTTLGGKRMYELDDDDNWIGSSQIPLMKPSAEDIAKHRAEFVENASQLGPVVATMDLENGSEFSDGDYLDDEELEEDDDDVNRHVIGYSVEELEDTGFEMDDGHQELTPEYIQEMEALMRKYNQPVMANVGPRDAGFPLATSLNPPVPKFDLPQEEHALDGATKPAEQKPSRKKGVRFAQELDIASNSPSSKVDVPVQEGNLPVRPKQTSSSDNIMSDIVERTPAPMYATENAGGMKRVSRFKASRSS